MTTPLFDNSRPHYSQLLDLFLATKEAEGKAPTTLRNYAESARYFLTTPSLPVNVREWRSDHLVLWLASLRRQGLAPATIAHHQRHVYVWLGWMLEHEDIEKDIRRSVKLVTVPLTRGRTATPTDYQRLMKVALDKAPTPRGKVAKDPYRYRNAALVSVMWATGIRRNELALARYEDVDLRESTLRVMHSKSKRERVVPFDTPTRRALLEYFMRERGDLPGPLFNMSSDAMKSVLKRLAERAGVDVTSHDFRRGFAARMRAGGLDVAHVARALGHSTLTMSLRYSEEGEDQSMIAAYRKVVG